MASIKETLDQINTVLKQSTTLVPTTTIVVKQFLGMMFNGEQSVIVYPVGVQTLQTHVYMRKMGDSSSLYEETIGMRDLVK